MAAAVVEPKNKCECDKITCTHTVKYGFCSDHTCKKYKSCCEPDCPNCKKCEKGKCKCRMPVCGCQTNCYGDSKNGKCRGQNNCIRCKVKCEKSEDGKCICYQCSCGPRCNGVICSCCSWCDSTNCSGGTCNGYVLGKCPVGSDCQGHVKYDEHGKPVWDRKEYLSNCKKLHGNDCTNNCNRWAITERDVNNNCVIKCTYCGKLCSQDICRIWLGVIVIFSLILASLFVMRAMFPEKFHSIMTRIRTAFFISSRNPSRPLSNLAGERVPVEINIDRYPAFRPRAYAGLA